MTRYPAWKRREVQKKWRDLLAVFLCVVLLFAVVNGIFKSLSLKKYLGESWWDGKSPLVVALGSLPPAFFIFQNDPKRIVVGSFSERLYFETGSKAKPLEEIPTLFADKNGKELARIISLNLRVPTKNYLFLRDLEKVSQDSVEARFKSFASLTTPFLLFAKSLGNMETNLTRVDLFRLWWQVKGLSVDKIVMVDLSVLSEEIVFSNNQKVLGVDSKLINRKIKEYLEDSTFIKSDHKLKIVNGSDNLESSLLALDFVESFGLEVVSVEESSLTYASQIIARDKDSNIAKYLAKIFDCDIKAMPDESQTHDILVILGQDFATRYFE